MTRTLNSPATLRAAASGQPKRGLAPARRRTASSGTLVFGAIIAAALLWGWMNEGGKLPSEIGETGYVLGIAGALSMLALLLYPLRKHARFMRSAGPVAYWFRAHMALGLIGPTLILYHAHFSLGSLNSNVALAAMLVVAGSGLIGRFFYAKIHKGLYGAKVDLKNLATDAAEFRRVIASDLDKPLSEKIDAIEAVAFETPAGMGAAAIKALSVTASSRSLEGAIRRKLNKAIRRARHNKIEARLLKEHLDFSDRYFRRIEQAAELGFYERLFAAWHLLHLPLFILLIFTAIIHVVAVHLY